VLESACYNRNLQAIPSFILYGLCLQSPLPVNGLDDSVSLPLPLRMDHLLMGVKGINYTTDHSTVESAKQTTALLLTHLQVGLDAVLCAHQLTVSASTPT